MTPTPPIAPTIVYDLFANDGAGGAVNYASPIATVSGTTWTGPALAFGSDTTFAIRTRDSANGVSEANVDARARVVVDPTGLDISGRPNAPSSLEARPAANGGALVLWTYTPLGQAAPPTGFQVFATRASLPFDWTTVAATVPYRPDLPQQRATLTGLLDGVAYQIGVRATNAAGAETNTTTIPLTADSTPPASVEGLTTA